MGMISLALFWRSLLDNISLQESSAAVVVFGNSCGQEFSYYIGNNEILYLGTGDEHDPKFTDYGVSVYQINSSIQISSYQVFGLQRSESLFNLTQSNGYGSIDLSEKSCPYDIRVYPSSSMEDVFITSRPSVFTAGVIVLFCFTSAVFVVYDIQVEKRQEIVMRSANQSSAIVSSLFPSNVRARLYAESDDPLALASKKQSLKTFLLSGNEGEEVDDEADHQYAYGTKPIADLFPETSIFFADLVGFTGMEICYSLKI